MESCDLLNGSGTDAGAQKWSGFSGITDGLVIDGKTCWRNAEQQTGLQYVTGDADEDTTMFIGLRCRSTGNGSDTSNSTQRRLLAFVNTGTAHIEVTQRGNGTLIFRHGGTGAELGRSTDFSFIANQWHYVEAKVFVHDTTGTVDLIIDGVTQISETGLDTRNGVQPEIDRLIFGANRNHTVYYRDIVIMNTAGSTLNNFLGSVVVEAVLADGAGNYSAWTPDTGSNFERIDESDPDSDTSYVEAGSTALRDSYTFADLTAITNAPLAVQATAIGRYTDSPLDIAMFVRRSSTDSDGTAFAPTGSYGSMTRKIWEDDPIAAGAWTISNFNASEFGIKT